MTTREDIIAFITAHSDVVDGPDWDRIIRDDINHRVAVIYHRSIFNDQNGALTLETIKRAGTHTDFLIHATTEQRRKLIALITDEDCA